MRYSLSLIVFVVILTEIISYYHNNNRCNGILSSISVSSLSSIPSMSKQMINHNSIHRSSNNLHKLSAKVNKWDPPKEELSSNDDNGIAYTIELPRRAGISWGSDLSFRWIYVLDLEPSGEAAATGLIQKGDYIIGIGNTSTLAQDFDFVLSTLKDQSETKFNYTFFRGSKEQLMGGPVLEPSDMTVTVTVVQDGKPNVVFNCPGGTNLRQLLIGKGINVYRSLTRWTNCNGKQRCGTCIVDIEKGLENCNRKALDEELVLRENPETYRLSCVTTVYGDITVKVQSPVGAAQWTR